MKFWQTNYRLWQLIILLVLLLLWHVISLNDELAFFFGRPLSVFAVIWQWFAVTGDIYEHLAITLAETIISFALGTIAGMLMGLWLGLSNTISKILDPYLTALNAMPRVILAPIFALWFGLGIWSKVALAFTLVFFIVFFNVYQGIKEVSPILLDNAKMLGANRRQLLRHIYIPSATSWVFSSLHASVGLAFVDAVVGEYLGSASGVGYLILQAEGSFDIDTVFAGIIVLTVAALVLDMIVRLFEKYLHTWKASSTVETEQV